MEILSPRMRKSPQRHQSVAINNVEYLNTSPDDSPDHLPGYNCVVFGKTRSYQHVANIHSPSSLSPNQIPLNINKLPKVQQRYK